MAKRKQKEVSVIEDHSGDDRNEYVTSLEVNNVVFNILHDTEKDTYGFVAENNEFNDEFGFKNQWEAGDKARQLAWNCKEGLDVAPRYEIVDTRLIGGHLVELLYYPATNTFSYKDLDKTEIKDFGFKCRLEAVEAAAKAVNEYTRAQPVTDEDEDGCGQYEIIEEAKWRDHKYMIVEDTPTHTILWATEFTNPDILREAPDFSKFYGYVTGEKDGAVDFAAEGAMRTIDDYVFNSCKEADKMGDEEMQPGCDTGDDKYPYDDEDPYEIYRDKDDSNMGKEGERHAQEEPQAVEMRRTLAWSINNLRMKVDQLKALCEKKHWNDDICYNIEECIAKLGECLAQLTIWDEEKYE